MFKAKQQGKTKDELIGIMWEQHKFIEQQEKQLGQQQKRLEEQDERIEELAKELRKYKNSNTPSSANKHLKPDTSGKKAKGGGKRGAPKGHKGTTRPTQTPDDHKKHDPDECPNCHGDNLKDKKVHTRIIEEIPEPVQPEIVAHEIHEKECLDCGLVFVPATATEIPRKGKFGINVMVLIIFIKFILRGVLRKSASFMDTHFALKMAPASVNAIIGRVAEAAEHEFGDLKRRIRLAQMVYVDETSFSVLGKKFWVWVFRTPSDILLVIRPSRGSAVLHEILGKDYAGIVICDCWSAYSMLKHAIFQRCWAHLLRKSKELCDTVTGRHFHEKLKVLFKEIKTFNAGNPAQEERDEQYEVMTRKLQELLKYYSRYPHLAEVIGYIDRKVDQWFTCIKIPGIEPTNNFAENAIRETVIVRKIIGAFRSLKGKEYYETLASLIATWQLQELDLQKELRQMLVKNLCYC